MQKRIYISRFSGHRSQDEAVAEIERYSVGLLVDVDCSPFSRQLVCALYTPICDDTVIPPTSVLPCQSLCTKVLSGCNALLTAFGYLDIVTSIVNCTSLPKDGLERCVTYTDDVRLILEEDA